MTYRVVKEEVSGDFSPAFKVVTREIDTPNQGIIKRYVVDHSPVVSMLIYDRVKKVFYMGKEYRSGVNEVRIGNSAGYIDEGEFPIEAAIREAREELGLNLVGADVTEISTISSSEGFTNEEAHLFYIEGAFEIGKTSFDDDEYIDLIELTVDEVMALITSGTIKGSKTVASFYWFLWKNKVY